MPDLNQYTAGNFPGFFILKPEADSDILTIRERSENLFQ